MQQLPVITAVTNCLDQGVEIPGTRNTGHCQYMHAQVLTTPLQPASTLREPAGHFFCLTIAQNIQKAYSKTWSSKHKGKGYLKKLMLLQLLQ